MKKILSLMIIGIIGIFLLTKCSESKNPWKISTGTISQVTQLDQGIYGCEFSYKIETDGNKTDTISQFYMDLKEEPIDNQVLKLKYNSEDPIEYVLIDPIQYKK
ncbi:hypothetical protein [Cetobacterium sp. SF1]|uniref:hypothetical protein n=1 Tax=unclassified Cetobacterium TaxID=2630983 RepID=UPI003CF04C9C